VDTENYDLVVLGSGTGSKVAAWTTAGQGKRVALVERKYIGGSCRNIACLPSKNIIHSAKVASYVRRSKECGITINDIRIDMSAVRERKRRMVSHSVDLHLEIFKKSGVELILGSGRFIGPRTLEVRQQDGTSRRVHGEKVIISTGTHARGLTSCLRPSRRQELSQY
jgi:pyruvate/2-oxoglutarate dehydrogenase complex dihydrolipoamide dehydrogenase (E3) component